MTEASCLLPVDMNLTIPPVVPALKLLKTCRTSPYNPVVLGQSSKRFTRDHSVDSPCNKSSKTHSIDETLDDLSDVIRTARKRQGREDSLYEEEIAQVKQIFEEDGYSEHDVVFMQALNLCLNKY